MVYRCSECGEPYGRPHAVWCPEYESGSVGDDLRGALQSEYPPAWHRWRLDRMVRREWRFVIVVMVILVLGTIAGLLA